MKLRIFTSKNILVFITKALSDLKQEEEKIKASIVKHEEKLKDSHSKLKMNNKMLARLKNMFGEEEEVNADKETRDTN